MSETDKAADKLVQSVRKSKSADKPVASRPKKAARRKAAAPARATAPERGDRPGDSGPTTHSLGGLRWPD